MFFLIAFLRLGKQLLSPSSIVGEFCDIAPAQLTKSSTVSFPLTTLTWLVSSLIFPKEKFMMADAFSRLALLNKLN